MHTRAKNELIQTWKAKESFRGRSQSSEKNLIQREKIELNRID